MSDFSEQAKGLGTKEYSELEYRVWGCIPDVYMSVLVRKEMIDVFGEHSAVVQAVWDRLWKDFEYTDINGVNKKIKNPAGTLLRTFIMWYGRDAVRREFEQNLRYLRITPSRRV